MSYIIVEEEIEVVNMSDACTVQNDGNTYKLIVRDPEFGTENYIENLSKSEAIAQAEKHSAENKAKVYIEWTDSNGKQGYLNRDGGMDCPGEPW